MIVDDGRHFAEEVALALEHLGMSRSAGRVLGWLLICDPPAQSMEDFMCALQASRSALREGTNVLLGMGLIARSRAPGERRWRYRLCEDAWLQLTHTVVVGMVALQALAGRGLELLEGSPPQQQRLRALRAGSVVVENRMRELLVRWRTVDRELRRPAQPE